MLSTPQQAPFQLKHSVEERVDLRVPARVPSYQKPGDDGPSPASSFDEADFGVELSLVNELSRTATIRLAVSLVTLLSFLGNFGGTSTQLLSWIPCAVLSGYTAWNLAAFLQIRMTGQAQGFVRGPQYFVELAVYTMLLSVDYQPQWIIYLAFLLSVLMLSSTHGRADVIRATLVCLFSWSAIQLFYIYIGWSHGTAGHLVTGFNVLVIGGGLAFLGGGELRKSRRLSLLLGLSRFSNPRFGVDETIGMMAQRLRSFFDTDSCVIIYTASDGLRHLVHRSDRRAHEQGTNAVTLVDSVAQRLLNLPDEQSVVYKGEGGLTRMARSFRSHRKAAGILPSQTFAEELEAVVEMFGAKAFMSVPLNLCFAKMGRVYLIDKRRRTFRQDELALVLDAVRLAKPAIENVQLVNNLATEAAEQERKRIAMDLHDTTIQPFIGLMLGLSAVRCRIELDPAGAVEDVSRLLRAAEAELGEVRGYVRALKDKDGEAYEFLTAVRRLTEKFEEASGIQIELDVEGPVKLNDRLAAEAFQLIAEGLSNIRRHARATHAALRIACRDNQLHLLFRNDVPEGVSPAAFCPRSLSERTASLGGTLKVSHEGVDGTHVQIFIPL